MTPDETQLDPAIVAELYVEHAEELRAFLMGVLRNGDLVAEALQATFAKAVECGHRSHVETRKGWLFQVAYHEALALRRKYKARAKSHQKFSWYREIRTQQDDPRSNLTRWETVEQVRNALRELPHEQREIVTRRIYEDKSFAEIAAELGVPLGTVLTRMRAAIKKLAYQLKADHTES